MIALHKNLLEEEAWECISYGHFINRATRWNNGHGQGNGDLNTPRFVIFRFELFIAINEYLQLSC